MGVWMGVLGAVGLFIAFGSGQEFTAKTRLLPYRNGAAGAAGLSGLAGLAGIRLPAGSADLTITADLYPEVAKSLDFRISVAETPLTFSSLSNKASTVQYFTNPTSTSPVELVQKYTIGLPRSILSYVRSKNSATERRPEATDTVALIPAYDQAYLDLVNSLQSRLKITTDRKTSIITVTGEMPDPYAAADLVRVSANRLMERIIDYESRKAGENFRFINEQYQQARGRYERTQRELALFADRNRALMSATAQIDRDRLQREYDLAFEVFQQFSRELEQARIKMNQDTPVFTILDNVTVPTIRSSPDRTRIVGFALLFGALLGLGHIALFKASKA